MVGFAIRDEKSSNRMGFKRQTGIFSQFSQQVSDRLLITAFQYGKTEPKLEKQHFFD